MAHLFTWLQHNPYADAGLGCTILPHRNTTPLSCVARRALESITQLRRWFSATTINAGSPAELPCRAVDNLIGLGPGLTPSGDDFQGGALIGLRLVGRHAAAERLFGSISSNPDISRNPISLSHLSAAAGGSCNAWIHAALCSLLEGDGRSLPPGLQKIDRIGHTSGWDTLAGAVSVLAAQATCTKVVALATSH